jgi:Sulfotransferase domain
MRFAPLPRAYAYEEAERQRCRHGPSRRQNVSLRGTCSISDGNTELIAYGLASFEAVTGRPIAPTHGRARSVRQEVRQAVVETLPGSWAPPGSRPIELVFRTVGERTSELALELALRHVKPDRAHVLRDVQPRSIAVQRMLHIDHQCSHVVYVSADCLILEDLRPFLDANDLPSVACLVLDRFRGRVGGGVHITRLDMVEAMRAIPEPIGALDYVLAPERYLCALAMRQSGYKKRLKNFHILHDHFQHYSDIFVKYARCELRSRNELYKDHFQASLSSWGEGADFDAARYGAYHAIRAVPSQATPGETERYLRALPSIAEVELRTLGLKRKDQVTIEEVEKAVANDPVNLGRPLRHFKVFGLGLSRTGTRSLTAALHVLGFDAVHYPTDQGTLDTLVRGDARFPLLEHYDGITDVTVARYYEALDHAWPGSKFVLTVRDRDSWLDSCAFHWSVPMADKQDRGPVYMEIQRFLRAAVYGSYEFDEQRFRRVYQRHVEGVTRYFAGRERDLLVLDIAAGQGYERLAPFLGVPVPRQPFPVKGKAATPSPVEAKARRF